MGEVLTFTILYLAMIAGSVAVLAAVVWYLAARYRRKSFEDLLAGALEGEGSGGAGGPDLAERLARLEAKVDTLWARVESGKKDAERTAPAGSAANEPAPDQAEPLRRYRNLVLVRGEASPGTPAAAGDGSRSPAPAELRERVYDGFTRGKTITDLARESGRGKGEIELIINLRRATGTDGPETGI